MSPDDFSQRYATFVSPITAFAARRVEAHEVDEIVADVFSVAWRKHSVVTEGEELPWLYRIASHVIANHRRKVARNTRLIAKLVVRDPAPSAESIAVADIALAAAWSALPPRYREVLALVAIDGLTVSEAAATLGITPNAVSVRLNRARTQLREELEKQA